MVTTPERFSAHFRCANCGQTGTRAWEEPSSRSRVQSEGRRLIEVSGGFHIEEGRTASGEPLVVCDTCDEIQPD
jgi:hypothetical protein